MKKFYMLMIALFAMLIGATGCGEADPAPEYGVPVNDNEYGIPYTDYDVVENDVDVDQPEYGVPLTDYDTAESDVDNSPDADYHYEYDSDVETTDDIGEPEYGVTPVDYDENPDEMTTDYGPISTKFHK